MKSLHVLSSLDPRNGGPSYALLGLVKAQRTAGIDASITATHYWDISDWAEYNRLVSEGCPSNVFPFRPWSLKHRGVGRLREFKEQLSADVRETDVVHIHGLWQAEQHLAATIAKQFKKPFVIRPCGMLAPWSMAQSRWKKQIYLQLRLNQRLRDASAIHFTTRREMRMSHVPSSHDAVVEPNGIDVAEFETLPERGTFRQRFSVDPTTRVVLFFGRVHHKKGIRLLIEAFSNIEAATLIVAGPDDTNHSTELRQRCDELGISERVLFTGPLYGKDRAAAFQDADVFALTSFHENFGNTVIESLACGTPVIVSDQVDVCEDLARETVCDVVQLEAASITQSLRDRLASPKDARTSRKCRELAFRKFDWLEIGRRWESHYNELISNYSTANRDESYDRLSVAS